MDRPNPQQLLDDREFIQNILQNNLQVVDVGTPDRKNAVLEILGRQLLMRGRRGGPTREDLQNLDAYCPGEQQVPANATKTEVVQDLLRRLRAGAPEDQNAGENADDGAPVPPAGAPPAGWAVPAPPAPPLRAAVCVLLSISRDFNQKMLDRLHRIEHKCCTPH